MRLGGPYLGANTFAALIASLREILSEAISANGFHLSHIVNDELLLQEAGRGKGLLADPAAEMLLEK